tara:strand:+ start:251 stop:769 length:519 start_codon:yes stop_codon:yes gene_type:complete
MSTLHVENLKGLSSGGNANKIIVPSGQTLQAAGHVLQVQTGGSSGYTTTNSNSGVDALTCSITPSATTSNVFVMMNLNAITVNAVQRWMILELYRDTTLVRRIHDDAGYSINHINYNTDVTCNFLDDTISTTSSVTYKLKMAASTGATVGFNNYGTANNRTSSIITLMEIAG